jgi:1-deoxy-D-xylulose-5-phosphate synthase
MESILRDAAELEECCVIHVKTQKGKGFRPAEEAPWAYHGIPPKGKSVPDSTFSQEFGKKLSVLADSDEKICAITAAMSDGTGLESFRAAHKDKLFDVGIAEPHAVTFAAGLAANGQKPVVAIYSTFLQRAYDNIIHDVALQSLPVTFCIDRAGLNASDGATHHGIFDVAFLSQIPNVDIYTPATIEGMKIALEKSLSNGKCNAIRYPSGAESELIMEVFYPDEHYTFDAIRTLDVDIADGIVITHGRITEEAIYAKKMLAEKGFCLGIILCEKIKPYFELTRKIAAVLPEKATKIVTLEEEIRAGGFGMMLLDALSEFDVMSNKKTKILATSDSFCIPEKGQTCYEASGVDRYSIVKAFE